jgi:hypothetical protein
MLITGNRTGRGSLDSVIRELSTQASLPVITIANTRRPMHDRDYAESVAVKLLEQLEHVELLRGVGRLFVP